MISPDIWCLAVERLVSAHHAREEASAVVIDDLRFPNDWQMWRRLGGVIVRLRRPGARRRLRRGSITQQIAPLCFVLRQERWGRSRFTRLSTIGIARPAQLEVINDGDIEATFGRLVSGLKQLSASERNG